MPKMFIGKFAAVVCLTSFGLLLADAATAQSLGASRSDMTSLRIAMMVVAVGGAFFLGWLCSPSAREFRMSGLIIGGVIAAAIAVYDGGFLGWSSALLVSVVGGIFAFGFWIGKTIKALGEVPTTFGSSRWATSEDVREQELFDEGGIRLGFAPDGLIDKPIAYNGDRHLLTVAPTRSGKGTTQIVPNLLTYEGSMLVIDPKGENALITAKRRQDMGQDVHIVDPWGIASVEGIEPATFNPLDWLDIRDPDITENAMLLADALVVANNHADSFWDEEAKALLQGLILYVASDSAYDGRRTLGEVRNILTSKPEEQDAVLNDMAGSMHRIIASTGARTMQKDDKLRANVMASAQAHTHFLESERITKSMDTSSFRFEDLKAQPTTIYLVLPADRLNAFGRWLRLLVQQAITINARNIETKPAKPVLFILDEFAAMGKLTMIEQAYGLMAGYGMQLWGIVQDFNQLERLYDKGWQSFVANAGMINYFGSSDRMTSEYFSAMCGETTVWNFSSAMSRAFGTTSGQSGGSSETTTQSDNAAASQRKLIYPDELMRMQQGQQLVLVENMHPLRAKRERWIDNPELKPLGVDLHTKAATETAPAPTAEEALNHGE